MRCTCITPGSISNLVMSSSAVGPTRGQDGLHRAGGAMHVDPASSMALDDGVDLFFGCILLHGDNHCFFPVSGV